MTTTNFNVCGLVVHLSPSRAVMTAEEISALPGVEITARAGHGRLVVTATDTAATLAIDQIAAIHRMPGVVAASLAYHGFEPDAAEPPPATPHITDTCSRPRGN